MSDKERIEKLEEIVRHLADLLYWRDIISFDTWQFYRGKDA